MGATTGFFRRPLDEVFAAPSHVAVLRALLDSAQGMSGREAGRQAGVSNAAASRALNRLVDCGVVERLGTGATQLFRLNEANVLVRDLLRPLLLQERQVYGRLLALLRESAGAASATVILFGSAARQEETADSDLDLLLIAHAAKDRASLHDLGASITETVRRQFGYRVSPMVLTRTELRQRTKRGDALVEAIRAEGIAVTGDSVEEVLNGTRSAAPTSR